MQPSFLDRNGNRKYAATAVVTNSPELLDHVQLITLFHELGHAIHKLLSRTKYSRFHGTKFNKDFTEVPSLLLEHWCWLPNVLKRLSQHFESGERIPDDLVNNIIRTKDFQRILDPLQLAYATFDTAIYSAPTQRHADEMNIPELYNKILCEIMGAEGPQTSSDWGHGYATRVHHMINMPAKYYTYISSYCFAERIWKSIFASDPMNKEAAMRYRRVVLEKGGSQNPWEIIENLLGERLKLEDLCN